jgi:biopolymer transport protein ExbD
MKKGKYLILLIIFMLTSFVSSANDVSFSVNAPRAVRAGEQFTITYILNKKPGNIKIPNELTDIFDLIGGPNVSQSSSIQVINNKMTRNEEYRYTYYFIAEKKGKYNIGPAIASISGETHRSKAFVIEVVEGSINANNRQQKRSESSSSSTSQEVPEGNLMLKVLLNKTNVYQGEQIVATVKLYSRYNVSGLENFDPPVFNGFYKQEIDIPELKSLQRENINGTIYLTGVLEKYVLIPQRAGKLEIEPGQIDVLIQQKASSGRSIFDDFFGNYQTARKRINNKKTLINVKPLPSNAPVSFEGAVGSFNLAVSLDKNELSTNDAATLSINVSGKGNLKLVSAPKVRIAETLDKFDPKMTSNIKVTGGGMHGNKKWEYVIIPRHAGEYVIPKITFSYFNPETGKYLTEQSEEFIIDVKQGKEQAGQSVITGLSKEEVKYIGKDIRFIKNTLNTVSLKKINFIGSTRYWLVILAILVMALTGYFVMANYYRKRGDVIGTRKKKASRFARKRLKLANSYLKNNDEKSFYEELLKAMWDYLSFKLSIPVAELNKETIRDRLSQKHICDESINQYIGVLDDAEIARYAPSAASKDKHQLYNEAFNSLINIEHNLKLTNNDK